MPLKIVENKKESIELSQLENGDVFKYSNYFYIVVDDNFCGVDTRVYNLTSRYIEDMHSSCEVAPVNATLTIN